MASTSGEALRPAWRVYARALLLLLLTCAVFGAVASWVVWLLHASGAFTEPEPFAFRMLVKAVFFTTASGALVAVLWRTGQSYFPQAHAAETAEPFDRRDVAAVALVVAVCAVLYLPNLNRYPWPAPDELHHLVVARNLAVYGAYASGHPTNGLVYFDPYDSVGPTVIAPIAGMIRTFGATLAAARSVMAVYGIALGVLIYLLFRPIVGRSGALGAAILPTFAFGTLYLSRSLYGEAPAMVFVLGGLLLWRRGLANPHARRWFIGAGILFGLAVLTKTILLISAVAFVAVWLFDRFQEKRISLSAMILPASGIVAVLGAWKLVVALSGLAGDHPSTIVYYRQHLYFGVQPFLEAVPRLIQGVPMMLAGIFGLAWVVSHVFRQRYDPAIIVLLTIAGLFGFWWLFFTPLHIPRYLWYTAATAAMCCGVLLPAMLSRAWRLRGPARLGWATAAILMLAVYAPHGVEKSSFVFSNDQAADERALATFVAGLPADTRIATTYWPAEYWLNYAAGRRVALLAPEDSAGPSYDVVIHNDRMGSTSASPGEPAKEMGHYAVYRSGGYRQALNDNGSGAR